MCVKRESYMDFWNKVIETFKKWRQGPGNDTFDPEAFFREIKQMGWLVDQCVFAGFMGEEGSLSNNPRPTAAISPPGITNGIADRTADEAAGVSAKQEEEEAQPQQPERLTLAMCRARWQLEGGVPVLVIQAFTQRLELFLMINCISGAHVKPLSSEKEKEGKGQPGPGQGQRQLTFAPPGQAAPPELVEPVEASVPASGKLRVDVGLDQVSVDSNAPEKLYIDKIPDALCFNYVGRIR